MSGFPDEYAEMAEAYLEKRHAGARFDRRGGDLWVEAPAPALEAIVRDFGEWQRHQFRNARMMAGTLCDCGAGAVPLPSAHEPLCAYRQAVKGESDNI
jgi:hypothetical protein